MGLHDNVLVAGGTRSCAHVRQSQFQLTKLVSLSLKFRQVLYAENRYISVEMAYIARLINKPVFPPVFNECH